MQHILEAFARGNITPQLRYFQPGSAYAKALQHLTDSEEALLSAMSEDRKDLVSAFSDAQAALSLLGTTDGFIQGYKLGVLMTMEVFQGAGDLVAGPAEGTC